MRGRNKIGNKMSASTNQMLQGERDKNKLKYLKEVVKDRAEQKTMDQDLEFLGKHDKKFEPMQNLKKQKQESD